MCRGAADSAPAAPNTIRSSVSSGRLARLGRGARAVAPAAVGRHAWRPAAPGAAAGRRRRRLDATAAAARPVVPRRRVARCRAGRPRGWGRPGRTWCRAGRLEVERRHALQRLLHELDEDRHGGHRAGLALAQRAVVVEADEGADHDLRREADEPGAAEVVGGAGLAAERPAQNCAPGRAVPRWTTPSSMVAIW